jgi:hypothetical protein
MGAPFPCLGPRSPRVRRALRVAALALLARAASACLAAAAVAALAPYDAAGPLTHHACDGVTREAGGRRTPTLLLLALTAWDGPFFGRAARCGPAWHEQAEAFAPATALAGSALAAVTGLEPETAALVASWAAFIVAAVALDAAAAFYFLPARNSTSPSARTTATLLFALGPASPFATALYAEAWHAAGLGGGLAAAAGGWPWASAACLSLATAARSTGAAGAALFALSTPPAPSRRGRGAGAVDRLARTALAVAPLALWQAHAWWTFCAGGGADAPPTTLPAWCETHRRLPLPLALPAVQSKFWGLGPGRYWRAANAPHFLLAAPALAIAAAAAAGAGGLASPARGVPGEFFLVFAFRSHPVFVFLFSRDQMTTKMKNTNAHVLNDAGVLFCVPAAEAFNNWVILMVSLVGLGV